MAQCSTERHCAHACSDNMAVSEIERLLLYLVVFDP